MRRFRRLLLALVGLGLVAVPAAAAQEATTSPAVGFVHDVDATVAPVLVSLLTDDLDASVDDVTVVENDVPVTSVAVDRASTLGREGEVVFVLDTSERLAAGGAFEAMKESVAARILDLPAGTRVAVVAAGDLALVRQPLTSDLAAAAGAVGELRTGTASALWDALDRGAAQFSSRNDRYRTVVVVSSSLDASRTSSVTTASAEVLRASAQTVAIRYRGGDGRLTNVIERAGGVVLGADDQAGFDRAVDRALALAGDRLVVSYPTSAGAGQLARVDLDVAETVTSFSFTGGARFERLTALAPITIDDPVRVPLIGELFASRAGLYLALVLAVIGVGLAVWALGSLVGNSNEDLDGRLSRYAVDPIGDEEADAGLGQSALFRRAVALTETFARDRGILVKTERMLEKANLPFRPAEALFLYAVIGVLVVTLGLLLTRSLLATVVLGALGIGGPYFFLTFKVARRQRKFESQLPDALQLLAGTLRAGYSLPQGMEAVSHEIEDPMGFELRRVMTEARLGRELEEALESAAERLGSPDFAWAVMAIGIQREVGGNLNELLMTVSDTMVARERLRGEVKTLTAEGKMSAIILGGLPPALGLVMYAMNPGYITTLFTEGLGQLFMGLAVLSATAGLFWMKKVITIDV